MQAIKSKYYYIQIPKSLPAVLINKREKVNKYETNRMIRAVDTFLCLKSLTTTGVIQNYNSQIDQLAHFAQITKPSFYNRLQYLHDRKLIEKKGGNIYLTSWKNFGKFFDIDCSHFLTIKYNPDDKRKIYQIISALEIQIAQQRQRDYFILKISKNPDIKRAIETLMIDAGADGKKLNDPVYFQKTLWQLQLLSFEQLTPGTDTNFLLNIFRADVNRCVTTIQAAYGYKSKQSISYIKKILSLNGIIQVRKQVTVSKVRGRKTDTWKETVKDKEVTRHPHVRWLQVPKQTIWFACDDIIVENLLADNKNLLSLPAKAAA